MSQSAQHDPTFSVIIPAYNAARTIQSAVRSALAQSVDDLEVVVVDDGCTDDTVAVLAGVADSRLRVISQPNRGLPAARNAGIAAARGTYLAFLDSDDLLLPPFLALGHQALTDCSYPGFAYTDAYVLEASSGRLRCRSAMAQFNPPVPPPDDPEEFLTALMKANFVYVSTIVPRSVLNAVGGFDEARTSCEDYELWLRILLAGYRVAWVPGRHAIYRLHPGQMTKDAMTMAQNLCAVYDGLPVSSMPSARHRYLLARRRRAAQLQLRLVAPIARHVPRHILSALRRRKVSESWYGTPPPAVADAFPNLLIV